MQGSSTCVSLISRLESNKEEGEGFDQSMPGLSNIVSRRKARCPLTNTPALRFALGYTFHSTLGGLDSREGRDGRAVPQVYSFGTKTQYFDRFFGRRCYVDTHAEDPHETTGFELFEAR